MNIRFQPPAPATSCSRAVDAVTLADLAQVFDPAVNLVRLQRPLPPGLADCLHAAHASGALGSGRRAVIDAGSPLPIGTLPELPGRDTVDADVQLLSGLLADLTGCTRVGVRIEVLDRAMCPRWHVDRVALRLLCTWIGPAAEWLDDRCADRSHLGSDAVMTDAAGIGRATAGDIVLLKGELWPDNAGRGVIHRSPQLDAPHRLRIVAAFDAVF